MDASEFNPTATDEFSAVISPISDTDIHAARSGQLMLRVFSFIVLSVAAMWVYRKLFR